MIVKKFIIVLSIVVMSGCSTFKLNHSNDLTYVDALIKDHEYEIALRFIDQLDKTSPNYPQIQKKHPIIIDKIKRYEQRILIQSNKLIELEKWSDSIELLENAVSHIPSSKKLTAKLNRQKSVRDTTLHKLQYQITLHEALSIKREQELYKRLYRLDSSATTTSDIVQNRAKTISDDLLKWAKIHVKDKETVKARNSLKLAGELIPEIRKGSLFRKLLRKIEVIEKEISKAIKKNKNIALNKFIKEFNLLFEKKKFIQSQRVLNKIENRFKKNIAIIALRKKFNHIVSLKIAEHMERGNAFYSREEVEYAINEWGNVLLLEPKNIEALENISRAVKVLKKLQSVRKNQAQ
ncbi:MAG: hypothetical protein OEL79_00465 [Chromatiales bacterium]|nr:hypothetical protein [Chromatiales bacterium]